MWSTPFDNTVRGGFYTDQVNPNRRKRLLYIADSYRTPRCGAIPCEFLFSIILRCGEVRVLLFEIPTVRCVAFVKRKTVRRGAVR